MPNRRTNNNHLTAANYRQPIIGNQLTTTHYRQPINNNPLTAANYRQPINNNPLMTNIKDNKNKVSIPRNLVFYYLFFILTGNTPEKYFPASILLISSQIVTIPFFIFMLLAIKL